jgi:integrase
MKRGKKGYESIYVPTQHGGLVQRSTGTAVAAVVRGMKRMTNELKDRALLSGNWVILEAIATNRRWTPPGQTRPRKFTLGDAYTFFASNRLKELEALLSAKNLAESLTPWITWVRANRRDEVRTADVYWQQVTTLISVGGFFAATDLTKDRVKEWLASRTEASAGTRRKYFYALKSFIAYLLDAGVYETDPLAGMKAPKKNPPRERWETIERDQAIVGAAIAQYRAFFACVKATGGDVGAIRRAQKGDFDLTNRTLDVRGTKTDRRKVHRAMIEAWAIPILTEHLKGIVGTHTLVFQGITNSGASHHHDRCCKAVGVEDYTLKDSRHSVGVRMRLRNETFEAIAEQLGTSVFQAVTVYTRYKPVDAQRVRKVSNA